MLPNICARHIVAFVDSFLSHMVAYVTSCVVSSLDVCSHITPRLQSFPNVGHFIYVWTSSALPQHMCDIRLAIEVTFQYISTCISTQLGLHFSGVCSDIWYTYANICDHICVRSYSYEIRSYLREIRSYRGGRISGRICARNSQQMQDYMLNIVPTYVWKCQWKCALKWGGRNKILKF